MIADRIREVIEFAEAYKGPGWCVSSAIEFFRYKDTGEMLWSFNMINRNVYTGGAGEAGDRLLVSIEDGIFQARSVELNRRYTSHYRKVKAKSAQETKEGA